MKTAILIRGHHYYTNPYGLLHYYNKILSKVLLTSLSEYTKKLDFIYIFQFKPTELQAALQRLNISLKSIINQNVNVKLCNVSEIDIKSNINYNIEYKYIPFRYELHNRSQLINIAVKELVTTDYFFISDIDLIYPQTFIKHMTGLLNIKIDKPLRITFYNTNLGLGRYTLDFNQLKQLAIESPDLERTFCGIAGGNGLIHKSSFDLIKGFDERYFAYGPEDQDMNMRISRINNYIALDFEGVNTFHVYHPLCRTSGLNNNKLFNAVKIVLNDPKTPAIVRSGEINFS